MYVFVYVQYVCFPTCFSPDFKFMYVCMYLTFAFSIYTVCMYFNRLQVNVCMYVCMYVW